MPSEKVKAVPQPDPELPSENPSHRSKERPADAGGSYTAEEAVAHPELSDAPMVSNVGEPDMPALERHDQHVAEVEKASGLKPGTPSTVRATRPEDTGRTGPPPEGATPRK
jgi:hypothetical protein